MDNLTLLLFDGTGFLAGLGMVLASGLILLRQHERRLNIPMTAICLAGTTLTVVSATPIPVPGYAALVLVTTATLLAGNRDGVRSVFRTCIALALTAVTLGIMTSEARYRLLPHVPARPDRPIYVIGDSISAGIGTGQQCWPSLLTGLTGLETVNLASPGATMESAGAQASRISIPGSTVIVEIGGNDLLCGTDPAVFRTGLDSLLGTLSAKHHRIIMFELPLLPFQNAYGSAQRELASKHGVTLLPKRLLTQVLSMRNGTLDGLHLSQEGHEALALILSAVLTSDRASLQ